MNYLRDPDAIYQQSWKTVEKEADLSSINDVGLREVVIRMIHACGMVEIADDIRYSDDFMTSACEAIHHQGASILCDGMMTVAGILQRHFPKNNRMIAPEFGQQTAADAKRARTTQSAIVAESWRPLLKGAMVVIGNSPTALFRLLEIIDEEEGRAKPAAIIGVPVGFVGAAESKQKLINNRHKIPFITVIGRRGGSAMAAAATNGLLLHTLDKAR